MAELILVVDDEPDIVHALEYNLRREGFDTCHALTGKGGLARATASPTPSLVLLDVMLPDISGTEICRQLRSFDATRQVPIIMLTAREQEIDRVIGFEVGADDYVVKPFSVRELMLRVRAILRRTQDAEPSATLAQFGSLEVDSAAHRIRVDGSEVALTALEFKLLTTLMQRRGRVQSRDTLLSDVWGMSASVTTRTVDTHVKRLRHKLGEAGQYVETLRGVGYRFRESPGTSP